MTLLSRTSLVSKEAGEACYLHVMYGQLVNTGVENVETGSDLAKPESNGGWGQGKRVREST